MRRVLLAAMLLLVPAAPSWAAVSAFTGSFLVDNANVATTTQNVSGLGFNPKACIFWWNTRPEAVDTANGTLAQGVIGWGSVASTADRQVVYQRSVDAASAGQEDGGWRADAIMVEVDNAATPATTGLLDINDLATPANDGFQVIYDDQFVSDHRVMFFCVGGDDITNADTGNTTAPATAVNLTVTSVGFQPDVVFLWQCSHTTTPPHGPSADRHCSFGAATATTEEGVAVEHSDDGSATIDVGSYNFSANSVAVLALANPTTSVILRGEFNGFTANGFDVNYLEVPGAQERLFWLVVKGGSWLVDKFDTSTTIDTDIVESGFGFQPRGALFWSGAKAESASDTPTANGEITIGAFHSTTARNATGFWEENGTANVEVATALEFDACYVNLSTGDAVEGLVDIQSIDADGFTMNQDDADPTANNVFYVAVGDTPAAPSFLPKQAGPGPVF